MPRLPDNTSQKELYEEAKDRMWELEAIYYLNREKIMKWLEASANEAIIVKPVGFGETGESKEDIKKHAMEEYPSLSKQLLGLYKIDKKTFHAQLLQDAGEGVFKQRTPSVISVGAWFSFFVLSAFFELGLFSYLVFYKGAGYGLLGLGIALFIGGLLAGYGLTHIMTHSKNFEYQTNKSRQLETKYIVYLIVGLILIVGVVAFRGIYGGVFAGIIAAFFGLLVIATETLFSYNLFLRGHYMDEMYRAQEYYAANALAEDLTDDIYYHIFNAKIDKAAKLLERKK